MPNVEKWEPKPKDETVDVVIFNGGEDEAYSIIDWIIQNGSIGLYSPPRLEADLEVYGEKIHVDAAPEEIIIERNDRYCKATPGMCVIKDTDGWFFTATQSDLESVFQRITKDS